MIRSGHSAALPPSLKRVSWFMVVTAFSSGCLWRDCRYLSDENYYSLLVATVMERLISIIEHRGAGVENNSRFHLFDVPRHARGARSPREIRFPRAARAVRKAAPPSC